MKNKKLRILWFTNTSSLYGKSNTYGGGWISSLEQIFLQEKNIELGISFFYSQELIEPIVRTTKYFPIVLKTGKKHPIRTVLNNWKKHKQIDKGLEKILDVVESFQPDLIQVFGTERVFASIQEYTEIPVVIHLQGIINPYLNTYYPPNQSKINFLLNPQFLWNNILGNSPIFRESEMKAQAIREEKNLKSAKFIMGRTHWDKMICKIYAPNAKYFHIDEVLRPIFYNYKNNIKPTNKITLSTTISSTTYKGIDLVLKTAALLLKESNIDFVWNFIGINKEDKILRHFEKALNLNTKYLKINCLGRVEANELIEILQSTDLFIHPSYIDNSPNSVCEAQMIGVPVIACNVGGLKSLIKNGETGILIPSNGVFELFHHIKEFSINQNEFHEMSFKAKVVAHQRHDRNKIKNNILKVYNKILHKQ